ncbi:hypothetical protein HK405_013637, partial [Cladochytrium tenue]
ILASPGAVTPPPPLPTATTPPVLPPLSLLPETVQRDGDGPLLADVQLEIDRILEKETSLRRGESPLSSSNAVGASGGSPSPSPGAHRSSVTPGALTDPDVSRPQSSMAEELFSSSFWSDAPPTAIGTTVVARASTAAAATAPISREVPAPLKPQAIEAVSDSALASTSLVRSPAATEGPKPVHSPVDAGDAALARKGGGCCTIL